MPEQEWKKWPTAGGFHWLATKRKWARMWSYEIVWVPQPREHGSFRHPFVGWQERDKLPANAWFSGPLKAPDGVPANNRA